MLKKIHVRDIRLGMFIQELCGSWMDHPFWKTTFKITDPKELYTLQHCIVQEIWIDTSKGLDVDASTQVIASGDEKHDIEQELRKAVETSPLSAPHVSFQEELEHARHLQTKSCEAITSMFHEVRMGNALHVADAEPLVEEINQSISRNPDAFLSLVRLKNKDNYTYMHSVAVCALMTSLGKQLGLSGQDLKDAGMAGLLHDVGKMMIPDKILHKPGALTDEEFNIIKAHPLKGWEILKNSTGVVAAALEVSLHHHERVDGKGYPDSISGDKLSEFARMGAICDVYDALTSNRCYKTGWEPSETLRKMTEWKNGHFDERIFYAFVKTIGIYPSGTLVKLKSGRLAVVVEQTRKSLLCPLVKAFYSTKSHMHIMPEMIDLNESADSIANVEIKEKWDFDWDRITLN